MSLEFEEREEVVSRLGSFILFISTIVFDILLGFALSATEEYGSKALSLLYTLTFMLFISLLIGALSLLSFIRLWMKFKINVFVAALFILIFNIVLIFITPGEPVKPELTVALYVFIWLNIGCTALIFISKRPNLGKESNKHIYQAYGAFIEFIVGSLLLFLGIYILTFDISQFAGEGTFPGGFVPTYIYSGEHRSIEVTYEIIRVSGIIMIIAAAIICFTAVVRNIISLNLASLIILIGIFVGIVAIGLFFQNWTTLDSLFNKEYSDEYHAQLALMDPFVIDLGVVLVMLLFIGLFMIMYASTQSEPLEKWRTRRNHFLAAAEVAIRDQKLGKAISYLEKGSIWSSKLGEEDRAVELITRIHNIKEKAIKLKKAEAAEKKKKELDAAKMKAKKKAEADKPSAVKKAIATKKPE